MRQYTVSMKDGGTVLRTETYNPAEHGNRTLEESIAALSRMDVHRIYAPVFSWELPFRTKGNHFIPKVFKEHFDGKREGKIGSLHFHWNKDGTHVYGAKSLDLGNYVLEINPAVRSKDELDSLAVCPPIVTSPIYRKGDTITVELTVGRDFPYPESSSKLVMGCDDRGNTYAVGIAPKSIVKVVPAPPPKPAVGDRVHISNSFASVAKIKAIIGDEAWIELDSGIGAVSSMSALSTQHVPMTA